jgi:sterol desaturase/sphingolipid hydroxylase (fatty acid hydroxylase superfamily)
MQLERWLTTDCVRAALGDPPRQTTIQVLRNALLDRWLARAHPALPAIVFGPLALTALAFAERRLEAGTLACAFAAGFLAFSLLEYGLHRFLFHHAFGTERSERITAFLTHGYHHTYPNDPGRLVLPPLLTLPLAALVGFAYSLCLPLAIAEAVLAGTVTGYIAYDSTHFWLHHGRARSTLGRWCKRYHLLHHHDRTLGRFGVTTPLWDIVFGSYLPTRRERRDVAAHVPRRPA